MATRIGVDVGGTFTDFVLYDDETGEVRVAKGPSTTSQPDVGVMNVVSATASPEVIGRTELFLHGTTVGINALLERNGAKVGLVTTAGFRDVLALRRGTREAMYDLLYQPEESLVPRWLRLGVTERILADGTIEQPLEIESVQAAAEHFAAEGVDAVAVCLLNSYVNPQHEIAVEEVLRETGFEGSITLSHRLSRELREFERTATSAVDAYVRPAVSTYLRRLDDGLRAAGFQGDSLITRSGGGSMSFREAEERPFETVMSGPVAGAGGAGLLASELGLRTAITADVGGTSFDTCLLLEGRPVVRYEGKVGDLPLQTPWVDVRSIGSGGGSIASTDASKILRVGPESSGAIPGPVCYSRGGTRPTTTDAAAVLGMLGHGKLAGNLQLDIEAAGIAVEGLGADLDLSRDETASGIITIAGAAMAAAVRSVTIERGEDPREAALIAYGGAGPMLATVIAQELDITSIVVPEHAGNFSACGLLDQDVTRTASATLLGALDAAGLAAADKTRRELTADLEARSPSRDAAADVRMETALDLRFRGQLYTLNIEWTDPSPSSSPDVLKESFESRYEKSFGHSLDSPLEIVAVRVTMREPLPRRGGARRGDGGARLEADSIDAYSFELGRRTQFTVVDRSTLDDSPASGPAIVLEPTTTTYVDDGWQARVGTSGAMLIDRNGGLR
jgi:N-methylhydantoinase A